jgi:ElaB/YqjD/DUF883 family membrane-anchored ribosome-binding protein
MGRKFEIVDEQTGRTFVVEDTEAADEPIPEPISQTESFARGAGQGATLGWGDEGAAAILDMLPDPKGYNRAERHGGNTRQVGLDQMRADNRAAEEANPWTYGAGSVAGTVPLAAATGGQMPAVQGAVARGALGAAEGGALGAVVGAGMATEGNRIEGAKVGGAVGAGAGAALPVAGAALAAGARKVAPALKGVADRARAAATGAYGGQLKKLARDKGADAVEEFGADVERLGLHEGGGPLPQSWETYAQNAAQAKQTAGQRIGELSELADRGGVRVNLGEIADDLMDEAVSLSKIPDAAAHSQADELMARAANFEGRGVPYGEAHGLRRFLDDLAYNAEQALQSQTAERARAVATKLRGKMDEAIKQADPALRDAMREANQTYSTASRASHYAEGRIAQEAGNQAISLPSMTAAAGGFAGAGPVGAVGGAVGGQLMKTRGASAIAGGARALQHGAERVAATATPGRLAASLPGVAAPRAVSISERVQQLAQSQPEALGDYGPTIARAVNDGDFGVTHSILQQTDPDYQRLLVGLEADEYTQAPGNEQE